MTAYVFYQIINIIMVLGIAVLLKMLYDRLEIVENRNLFVATLGVAIDLLAWFTISHVDSAEAAATILRISIFGRVFFGLGFISYMIKHYKARFQWAVWGIWGISTLGMIVHSINLPVEHSFLGNGRIENINGIMVFMGQRDLVYFVHAIVVLSLGIWSVVLILKSIIERSERFEGATVVNDIFYIVAVLMQGTIYILNELFYYRAVNFTPIFRALATGMYAVLSIKYNLLTYDQLARQSILKDVGAGFVALSEKYKLLYANELAYEIYPWLSDTALFSETVKDAIRKKEFQIDRNGSTYKVTANRIITNGRLDGFTLLCVDISDIVRLENQAVINEVAKKNLLSNISNELKVPLDVIEEAADELRMNANSLDKVSEFADTIRVAANNMDDILDDILTASTEYTKPEECIDVPFSICTLVDNVVDICSERVLNSSVNFEINFDKNIPVRAIGDDKRILRLLCTILTNAIRYTDEGSILLDVSGEYMDDGRFKYVYTIKNTGRGPIENGINGERSFDMDKLDASYNTSYGISILVAKRIVEVLKGEFLLRTNPDASNIYTISIPSRITDSKTIESVELGSSMKLTILGEPDLSYKSIQVACRNLGIETNNCLNISSLKKPEKTSDLPNFLLYDYNSMGRKVLSSEKAKTYKKIAILSGGNMPKEYDPDTIFVKKPLSVLTIYKAYLEYVERSRQSVVGERTFTAPQARVLVVDDNSMNLQIAKNMLETFKVFVSTCSSGYECLKLLDAGQTFDLIFMDYMMEGMDGIETTRHIREMRNAMKDVPILAYTANAVSGAKENYLAAGMNDVVYKPANIRAFSEALREYLPFKLLVIEKEEEKKELVIEDPGFPDIEGVDKEHAIKYCGGNLTMYEDMLACFALDIDKRKEEIINYKNRGDYKNFTVSVHGVKGLARTLGITGLSGDMALMEKAGAGEDSDYIDKNLASLLSEYETYKDILLPYVEKKQKSKYSKAPVDEVEEKLRKMKDFLEDFEMDETEALMNELWPGEYDEVKLPLMKGLKEAIENVDYYTSKDFVEMLLDTYSK